MEEPVPTELILLMEAIKKCQLLERVSRIGHRRIQPYLLSTSTYKMADQPVSRRAKTIFEMEVRAIDHEWLYIIWIKGLSTTTREEVVVIGITPRTSRN